MGRKFLPGLRGLTQSKSLEPEQGSESKMLSISGGGYSSHTNLARGSIMYGSQGRADAWDMETVISEGYERDVWVFRCVELVAGHAARLPFGAARNLGSDNEERLQAHPLFKVMNRRANPMEKGYAFRKRLSQQLLLSKRGVFVEVQKSRGGAIVRLDLLDPSRVRPIEDPHGDYISHFEFTRRDGQVREIDPSRIRWIREPHPTDPFSGVTPLEAAGMSVELDFLSRLYNNSFIRNDSRPGGILGIDHDYLSDQEMERIERKMRPGAQNAGEMTVLATGPGGMRYIDTTTKPRDMAYEHASANSKNEILSAFGIGESLLGNAAGRTYDNAESELYSFWTTVMPPHLSLIASAFDEDLDEDWDPFFDTSGIEVLELPRRRDREEARNEVTQGLRSIDEYRPIANLRPLDTPQTRALWISPAKAPVPARPEDAAALGLGVGGEGEPGAGAAMPGEGGAEGENATAADAVAEARAVEAGGAEGGNGEPGAAAALDEARQGTSGGGEPGAARAALEEASVDYSGSAPGDAATAVRSARRMMERKSLPGEHVRFVPDDSARESLTMSVKAAVDAMLARQQGVVTARLESPKTRKGTRFWTPEGSWDTRGGDAPLDVDKVVDAPRWQEEAFQTVAPLAANGSQEAADGLYAELDGKGMIAGGGAPSSLVWAAPALEGAMAASDGVKSLLSEVQDAAERASQTAKSIVEVKAAVDAVYAASAPRVAAEVAESVATIALSGARGALVTSLVPAPGSTGQPVEVGGAWVVDGGASFLAPPA